MKMKQYRFQYRDRWLIGLFVFLVFQLHGTEYQEPDCAPCKLEVALNNLSEHYAVLFSYRTALVEGVDVTFQIQENESFNVALNRLLKGLDLNYKSIDSKYYLIFDGNNKSNKSVRKMERKLKSIRNLERESGIQLFQKPENDQIALQKLQESVSPFVVNINIEGTVVDENGAPLIGVNSQVKGTQQGTSTDIDGHFNLEGIDENAVLMVSYIGYQTQEVALNGRSNISITMITDSELLNEVVVVGYGTVQRRELTGSVSS